MKVWRENAGLPVRIIHGLVEGCPHRYMVTQVCTQAPVEVGTTCLQMGRQATVLVWQIIVLLLVHLLIDDIFFRDSQTTACSAEVDLGSPSGGLDTCFN
jgi:hypothetical protein